MNPVLLKTAGWVTGIALWLKKGQKLKPGTGIIKVNIGAGLSVVPGWINIDSGPHVLAAKMPAFITRALYSFTDIKKQYSAEEYLRLLKENTFVLHDLKYGLPLPGDSVDFLYSSHLLEHFYRKDAAGLMKEAYRVLKKGGRMRVGVPDLEYVVSLYRDGDTQKALSYFFPAAAADDKYSRHKYMYDYHLLEALLAEAGFTGIEKCGFRQGKVPDIEKLDNRLEETLFVEAVK